MPVVTVVSLRFGILLGIGLEPTKEAPMAPKLFTLDEANRLVPKLETLLRRLVEHRQALREHEQVIEEFRAVAGKSGGGLPGGRFGQARAAAEQLGAEIAAGVRQIEALGCVVKDLDQGLVDFLSRRGDDTVFLCWRLGEPTIRYWHGLKEGFAGRKPLEHDESE
jgi:hypothetical protein